MKSFQIQGYYLFHAQTYLPQTAAFFNAFLVRYSFPIIILLSLWLSFAWNMRGTAKHLMV